MKKDFKFALLFALLGVTAGAAVVPYQLAALEQTAGDLLEGMPAMPVVMAAAGIQIGILSFVLSLIGLKLSRRVGLSSVFFEDLASGKKPTLSRKAVQVSVVWGAIVGALIVLTDHFLFKGLIPELAEVASSPSLAGLIGGVLYGGIVEEVLMRLFLMSLVVWLTVKILRRESTEPIPNWVYITAILFTAIVFAVGHFPFTVSLFGRLDAPLLVRGLLLNSVGGIVFGYLFWKYSLVYAIIAHMLAHVTMQVLFFIF